MTLTKLWGPAQGQMYVAGLMSEKGTLLESIIKLERDIAKTREPPFKVVVLYTDKPDTSRTRELGEQYEIPVLDYDYKDFCQLNEKSTLDLEFRKKYDARTVRVLNAFGVKVVACGGYMLIATPVLTNAFLCINSHCADLSVLDERGKRKYKGDGAASGVEKAILAGEKYLRATTHIMTEEVDGGPLLMRSAPLEVTLDADFDPGNQELVKKVAGEHQDRLKIIGDHVIFPRTISDIALGKFAKDETGLIYYEGKTIPYGFLAG